jgi:hypothetical protein
MTPFIKHSGQAQPEVKPIEDNDQAVRSNTSISIGPYILMFGGKVLGHADNLTLVIAEATEEELKTLKNARIILLLKVDAAHFSSVMKEARQNEQ